MVRNRCSTSNPQNSNRIQDSFPRKTTSSSSVKTEQGIRDSTLRRNGEGDIKHAQQRRYSSQRALHGVPVHNISQEKIRRHEQTYRQPKKVELVRTRTSIQTLKSLQNSISSKSKRFHGQNRHLPSILSRSDSTISLQVPVHSLQRKNVRDDLPPVRASKCSIRLLKNNKLVSTLVPTSGRYKNDSIFGRFSHYSSKSKNLRKASRVCGSEASRVRVVSEQEKVYRRTLSVHRVPRSNLEHQGESKKAVKYQNQTDRVIDPKVSRKKTLELVRRKDPVGEAKLRSVCDSLGEITLPLVANRVQQAKKVVASQTVPHVSKGYHRTRMVVGKCKEGHGNSSSQPNYVHHHRCSRYGLGGNSEQPEVLWAVDQTTKTLALQPKRTVGNLRNYAASRFRSTEHDCNMADRQPNSSRIHYKTRRYEVKDASGNSKEHPTIMRSAQLQFNRSLHSGPLQWTRRQPLQSKKTTGVAPKASNNEGHLSRAWHSRDRLIRFEPIHSFAEIRERRRIRHQKSIHRCVQSNLAFQPGVDLPSTSSNTANSTSSGDVDRIISPRNTGVEQGFLVSGDKETGNPTTLDNTEPTKPPGGPADKSTSGRSGQPHFAGLDSTGWSNEVASWDDYEVDLLQASWRNSTLKTYRPAWQRWLKWASDKNIQVDNPQPNDLARFLCFLFEVEKLAPRTILLHKSVVTTFANPQNSSVLSSHPIVSHVIKGILSRKPPVKKTLSWNLDDLLNFLESYDVDINSLFSVSRHTSTLLLLASGRRVHDLTLLNIDSNNFEQRGDEIVFWPIYGSKTDSVSYRQSGWGLKSNIRMRFNIVYWVKQVLKLSQSRRGPKDLKSLFITTRGVVKEASRAVIAGWIKTLFREANIVSSPGSIRACVATDNWTRKNLDIDEVLKRGNWRSKNTFLRHYFQEIRPRQPDSSSGINICTSFLPVT